MAAGRDRLRAALEPFAAIGRAILDGTDDGGWMESEAFVRAARRPS